MKVLAVSGSLRASSSNTTILRAAARLASGLEVVLYEGLGTLPHFNPDLDVEPLPGPVADLRARMAEATGLVMSSPEYAHGVPGSLKNMLDWQVSDPSMIAMPVLLINAAPVGATYAQAALAETMRTMSMNVLSASLTEPFMKKRASSDGELDGEAAARIAGAMRALEEACRSREPAF